MSVSFAVLGSTSKKLPITEGRKESEMFADLNDKLRQKDKEIRDLAQANKEK
jgi:hypothetical protein